MRCLSFSIVLATLTSAASLAAQPAQPGLRPAPSGRATSVVTLAVPRDPAAANAAPAAPSTQPPITIKLDYGQPHLRGRALHTDSLVPYDSTWRAGANDPTTLTTDVDLVLGGATVPKGNYALWVLPTKGDWKLIVQKREGQTGQYDAALDIARVDLRRRTVTEPLESLTMWLIPSTAPGKAQGELRLTWGTSSVFTTWSVK